MSHTPINNSGKNTRFVNGKMVPAGEMRMVPDKLLPAKKVPAAAPENSSEEKAYAEILGHSVKDLSTIIPAIETEDLEAMIALEMAAYRPRTGAIDAIGKEILTRAELAVTLDDAKVEDIEALILSYAEKPVLVNMILSAFPNYESETEDAES